jgi:hypothetical protein
MLEPGGVSEEKTDQMLIMLPPSGPKYFNDSFDARSSPSTFKLKIL